MPGWAQHETGRWGVWGARRRGPAFGLGRQSSLFSTHKCHLPMVKSGPPISGVQEVLARVLLIYDVQVSSYCEPNVSNLHRIMNQKKQLCCRLSRFILVAACGLAE